MIHDDADDDDVEALMRRLGGMWIVQALGVAAELRIAEALAEPRTLAELSEAVGCQSAPLARLLRALAGEGIIETRADDRFALTPRGRLLRQDQLGSLAAFIASPSQWTPWTALIDRLRADLVPFRQVHGASLFEYLEQHPDEARRYDEAVDAFTAVQARAFAELPTLDGIRTVVDVGGGRGTLLWWLLHLRPKLCGVLFDRPHVVEAAAPRFAAAELRSRFEPVGGDFFAAVPEGADAYVIKHVLHNWPDDRAGAILEACAAAAGNAGSVFVIEAIVLPGDRRDGARLLDLEMMVLTDGGRERTKPEFRALFHRAGLRLVHTTRLNDGAWAMEAKRR